MTPQGGARLQLCFSAATQCGAIWRVQLQVTPLPLPPPPPSPPLTPLQRRDAERGSVRGRQRRQVRLAGAAALCIGQHWLAVIMLHEPAHKPLCMALEASFI